VTIESPRMLLGLLLLVPVVAIQLRAFAKGRSEILMLGVQWPADQVERLYTVKWFFSTVAFDLFLVFAVLAAANITWGDTPVEEDRAGLDVAIVVDVSRSMLATDVEPSRLVRSLAVVRAMSRQLPTARMALVAFKGDAITLMPMTGDINALRSFPEGSFAHGAVVVLSDGEALSGQTEGPLSELRRRGIPAVVVVAGTPEGAPVPGSEETALLDEDGRPVISRADTAHLADIAARSDGSLFLLNAPDIVSQLAEELSGYVRVREQEGFRLVPHRRYRLFLSVAMVALLISIGIRGIRWRDMF